MPFDDKYETMYRESRDVCGAPFSEFASFFKVYEKDHANILDLGCGQGRDALMVARHGHRVLGVDISKTGIRQMLEEAQRENFEITGTVADIAEYEIEGSFDIVILDRVLHMIEEDARIRVLQGTLPHVLPNGFVLIADMPSNTPALQRVFDEDTHPWFSVLEKKGFLFMKRAHG